MSKKLKVLFFVPHPDDLEFGASLMCIQSLRLGYDVVEVLMTGGEYGTKRDEFKGTRLARIRKVELAKTVQVYEKHTSNKLRIHRMGFIDGFVNFNKKNIIKVKDFIFKEQPEIVFAPDPWHALDFHPDHLNTGRMVFFALKELLANERPKRYYLYYSFKTNIALKCQLKDVKIMLEVLKQHESQVTPLSLTLMKLYKKLSILAPYHLNKGKGVKYRKVESIDGSNEELEKFTSITDLIRYAFYRKAIASIPLREKYTPTPKELGLLF